MTRALPDLDSLVAHRAPMQLIDTVTEASRTHAVATATVRRDNLFYLPGRGLPAYVVIEMMAQTVAVVDGFIRWQGRDPAKVGFLLGCRKCVFQRPYLAAGSRLTIAATMAFSDGAMFSFECSAREGDNPFAAANLNVFAPQKPSEFLADDRHELR